MSGTSMRLYDKRSTGPREAKMTSHNVAQLFDLVAEMDRRMRNVESSVLGITSAGYVGGAGVTNYHAVWSSVDTLRASGHVFDDATNERTGYNTVTPRRKVDILDTTNPQLRLTNIDDTIYTDFQSDGDGNLLVEPTGYAVGIRPGGTIPAWALSALHVGSYRNAIAANASGGNVTYIAANAYCDGAWKSVAAVGGVADALIAEFDATKEVRFKFYDVAAADTALSEANQESEFLFQSADNPYMQVAAKTRLLDGAGNTAYTARLILTGSYFDDGDDSNTALSMRWRLLPESKTTYQMQLLANDGTSVLMYEDESGHTGILGQTIIGSVTIAQIGELDVYQIGCPVNPYFHLRHGDVAHGMTDYLSADAFFLADIRDETYGGVNLIGASVTTAQTPMSIFGIAGSYCGSQPYMKFIVGKDDGASGITNIGDTEIGYDFKDYTQSLVKIYGNGNVWILGNLTINDIPAATIDTDKFLVSDSGLVKYRTGAELLSDIGASSSAHNHDHATLTNLDSASYTHLTAVNHTDLTDGGETTLHKHVAAQINIPNGLGTPTYDDLQDFLNLHQSSGRLTGGVLTAHAPPDGTLDISAMEGMIHTANTLGAPLIYFKKAATASIALTDLAVNYIIITYTEPLGVPTLTYSTSASRPADGTYNAFVVGRCWRSGNDVEVITTGQNIYDMYGRVQDRLLTKYGTMDHASGAVISAHATPLRLSSTAGVWYFGNTRIDTGAADKFHVWYKTGGGAWTESAELTLFSEVFDGGTSKVYEKYQNGTSLGTLSGSKYGVYWIFTCPEGELYVVLGTSDYANIGAAQAATVPASLPPYMVNWGILIGRVICQKTAAAFYSVESVFSIAFTLSAVVDHSSLADLAADDHAQYLLLAGRSGGQVAYGGTGSGDDLTLDSTSDATAGLVLIQTAGGTTVIGADSTGIPAWTKPAVHIGTQLASISSTETDNLNLAVNAHRDTSWKSVAAGGVWIFELDASDEMLLSYYEAAGADEELGVATNLLTQMRFEHDATNPYLELLNNELTGDTGAHSMSILMRGHYDETELGMWWRLLPESTSTYKMQLLAIDGSTELGYTDEAGNTYLKGMLGIGAEPSTNMLTVYQAGCPSVPSIELQNGAVTHGFTDYLTEHAFLNVDINYEQNGGASITGAMENLTYGAALKLTGLATSPCSAHAYMEFIVGADSGTGATNIGDAEVGFTWKDYDQTLMTLTGAGALHVLGAVDTDNTLHVDGAITGDSTLQIDGQGAFGAALLASGMLYSYTNDATITTGIWGETASTQASNRGIIGRAMGAGTLNHAIYARAQNAGTNYHFADYAGNYSDATGWHDVSDPARKTMINTLEKEHLDMFYSALENVDVKRFRYKAEIPLKRDKGKLIPTGRTIKDDTGVDEVEYEREPEDKAPERYGFLATELPDWLTDAQHSSVQASWMCSVLWEIVKDQKRRIEALETA